MAFIPVPNTIKLSFEWVIAGQRVVCGFFFEKPGAVVASDLTAATVEAINWWNSSGKPLAVNNMSLHAVNATDQTTDSGQSFTNSPVPIAGTGGVQDTPTNAALVASLRTLNRGRSFRGRIYWPGIPANQMSNAVQVANSYAGALNDAVVGLINGFQDIGLQCVVVSRFSNNAPRLVGLTTPVTSVIVEPNIDSQRRRLNLRGE